ncbi:MAG: hypothetical protein EBS01_16010 [Verrucomicrobia bacterium]|nr:hypothetical protein [Verrucomicrobiota bacterium]
MIYKQLEIGLQASARRWLPGVLQAFWFQGARRRGISDLDCLLRESRTANPVLTLFPRRGAAAFEIFQQRSGFCHLEIVLVERQPHFLDDILCPFVLEF